MSARPGSSCPRTADAARLARINGAPGVMLSHAGVVFQTMGLEIADGRIVAVYTIRNPDKLARLNS